jgi:hypothetical protein
LKLDDNQVSRTKNYRNNAVSIGRALALVLAILSAISYVVSLVIGPILFFSTSDGLAAASHVIHSVPIDIFMAISIPIPADISAGVLFMIIWVLFVACLSLAWFSGEGFVHSAAGALKSPISMAKTSFLYVMPLVAAGVLYLTVLIEQFQTTQGVQTGNLNFPPQTSPYIILLNVAFAPLREEFAFRITSIGIPLGLFLLLRYRSDPKLAGVWNRVKLVLLATYSPELAKARIGYRTVSTDGLFRGISPLEWILILLTGAIFGAAHYLLGGGWQVGKISTAFLAGFVFGIMFVTYGAYATILMHWFFNYYFTIFDMAATTYGGLFSSLSDYIALLNLTAGQIILLLFLLVSAYKMADYLSRRAAGLAGTQTG